jgi:hypothetical protein
MCKKFILSLLTITLILISITANSAINENYVFSLEFNLNKNKLYIPKLEWHPKYYDFGYIQPDNLYYTNFEIWNNGTDIMYWNLNVRDDWVNVNPSYGYSIGEHDLINITINTTNLRSGKYEGNVYIHSEGDYIFYTYFIISEEKLAFYPKKFNINNLKQNNIYELEFEIWNEGPSIINWHAESNSSLIKIKPSNGSSDSTHDTIIIEIDTNNQKSGKYYEIINIYSNGGNGRLEINFTINNPPHKPLINGKTRIKKDQEYSYNITSSDPDGDNISYYIDWGDGKNNTWSNFFSTGNSYNINKIWNEEGIYQIRAKAKDIYNFESDWSIIEVEVPNRFFINIENNNFFHIINKILSISKDISI